MDNILQTMKNDFDCFIEKADSFIKSQTPSIPASAICYFMDGDQWQCFFGDFINLQESLVGFGNTQSEALVDLNKKFQAEKDKLADKR